MLYSTVRHGGGISCRQDRPDPFRLQPTDVDADTNGFPPTFTSQTLRGCVPNARATTGINPGNLARQSVKLGSSGRRLPSRNFAGSLPIGLPFDFRQAIALSSSVLSECPRMRKLDRRKEVQ